MFHKNTVFLQHKMFNFCTCWSPPAGTVSSNSDGFDYWGSRVYLNWNESLTTSFYYTVTNYITLRGKHVSLSYRIKLKMILQELKCIWQCYITDYSVINVCYKTFIKRFFQTKQITFTSLSLVLCSNVQFRATMYAD
jgi:hypothetical protein